MFTREREEAIKLTWNSTQTHDPAISDFQPPHRSSTVPIWSLKTGRHIPVVIIIVNFIGFVAHHQLGFTPQLTPIIFWLVSSPKMARLSSNGHLEVHSCRDRLRHHRRLWEVTAGTIGLELSDLSFPTTVDWISITVDRWRQFGNFIFWGQFCNFWPCRGFSEFWNWGLVVITIPRVIQWFIISEYFNDLRTRGYFGNFIAQEL